MFLTKSRMDKMIKNAKNTGIVEGIFFSIVVGGAGYVINKQYQEKKFQSMFKDDDFFNKMGEPEIKSTINIEPVEETSEEQSAAVKKAKQQRKPRKPRKAKTTTEAETMDPNYNPENEMQ